MKRFLSWALLGSMMLPLIGCGSTVSADTAETAAQTENATTTEAVTTAEKTPLELLEIRDMGGATYTMVYGDDYSNQYITFPSGELTGEVWNDALYERHTYVEDNYNVKIKYITDKSSTTANTLTQAATAGDKSYNFYISGASSGLKTLPAKGALANFNDFKDIDLSGTWWSQLMNENLRLNGKLYITSGDIAPALYSMLSAIYLNVTVMKDVGRYQDFYSVVREGKWTLDTFYNLTKDLNQDKNNDGTITCEDDFLGFTYMPNTVTTGAFIAGCGVKFNTVEKDTIKVDLMTEKVINAIDKSKKCFDECTYKESKNAIYAFAEDRALAVIHLTSTANSYFRDMKSDFMVMPQPKYDEAQEEYITYSNTWTPGYVGIPLLADKELTGIVTEALARYSYVNIRPQIVDTVMKIKVTRDAETAEMLDIIFNSAYIDLSSIYDFGGTKSVIQKVLFNGENLASSMASAQEKTASAIADFVKNW